MTNWRDVLQAAKRCSKCGQEKPYNAFSKRPQNTDGLQAWCKQCIREYGRDWYQKNCESRLARCRGYNKFEDGKKTRRKSRLKCIHKIRANAYLNNAIKDGRFERGTVCVDCGARTFIEGHHANYTKPLDVEWLCVTCHAKRHRKN